MKALEVDRLGKAYYKKPASPATLLWPFGSRSRKEAFWALRDLTFSLEAGQSLGIMGSNGSGKSTLLKMLAGVSRPTEGHATIRGRLAPLLEVGTGFHPDLSGRDNVFMNGHLLGMRKAEIRKYFDEIVAFSGVENFIDEPVRNYSSGMYVRLAFAVAAHLEADIMLLDEVLAVGDLAFQTKCFQKMEDLKHEGRTLLLVSHQLENLNRVCKNGLWIEAGKLRDCGEMGALAEAYRNHMLAKAQNQSPAERVDRRGSAEVQLHSLSIKDLNNQSVQRVYSWQALTLELELVSKLPPNTQQRGLRIQLNFYNQAGQFAGSFDSMAELEAQVIGQNLKLRTSLLHWPFAPGHYTCVARLLLHQKPADRLEAAMQFEVLGSLRNAQNKQSAMLLPLSWAFIPSQP